MTIFIFSSSIFFKKYFLIEYPKVIIIPGLTTAEKREPINGIISKACENSKILDTPPNRVAKFAPLGPKVNNLVSLYSSSLNPYNFAAYLIIASSKAKIIGRSAKGIGIKPAKEEIPAEIAI